MAAGPLLGLPGFWRAQARAFGLPADSRELYVEHGLSIDRENARRMLAEVYAGGVPDLSRFGGELLAVAGTKEPAVTRRSLAAIADAGGSLPGDHVTTRLAPGMHHVWNVEDVDLFNDMLRTWFTERRPAAGLVEPR